MRICARNCEFAGRRQKDVLWGLFGFQFSISELPLAPPTETSASIASTVIYFLPPETDAQIKRLWKI